MRKKVLNIVATILFGLGIFMVSNEVFAKSYSMGFRAYHAAVCGDVSKKTGATNCMKKALRGELASYEITDGHIEADETIMVLLDVGVSGNLDLGMISAEIVTDPSKLTLSTRTAINEEVGVDYAVLPYDEDEEETRWQLSLIYADVDKTAVLNVYDDCISIADRMPLLKGGTFGALFYTVNSDIQPGDEVVIEYRKGDVYPSASTEDGTKISIEENFDISSLTLSVASNISGDGTLKTLKATGNNTLDYTIADFVPSDKDSLSYNLTVPNVVNEIGFYGTPTSNTIKGGTGFEDISTPSVVAMSTSFTNGHSLQVGNNPITLTVTAESGDVTTYSVDVLRLSNDSSLASVSATNGVSFATPLSTTANSTTVPYKTTSTSITAVPTHAEATLKSIVDGSDVLFNGSWDIATDDNTNYSNNYSIKVLAEDCKDEYASVPGNTCSSSIYPFEIIRTAPSKNVDLSSLTVDGVSVPEFNSNKLEYTIPAIAADKSSIDIQATVADSLSSVSGTGVQTTKVGDNTFVVTVLGEDGKTKKEYKIFLHRNSDNKKLTSLTVTSNPQATLAPAFNTDLDVEYTYTYAASVSQIDITATAMDTGKAYVSILDFSTSESFDASTIEKTLNSATKSFNDETTKVGVVVTAEDGSTRVYKIRLSRLQSSNSELTDLNITPGGIKETFVSTKRDYTAEVDADVTSVNVTYTLSDKHATIQSITGADHLDFGVNRITVVVEAEDKSVTNYIIDVTRKQYDIATVSSIKVGYDGNTPSEIPSFAPEKLSYELSTKTAPISFDTKTLEIVVEKSNEFASVVGDGTITLANHSSKKLVSDDAGKKVYEYTFVVTGTSQSGKDTKNYELKLYQEANDDKSVSGVRVHGETATVDNTDNHIYRVTLSNDKSSVVGNDIAVTTNGTVQMITTSLNLSTTSDNIFEFEVVAENGTKETYQIYITREKSSAKDMTRVNLTIDGNSTQKYCLFENGTTTCQIDVPTGTSGYTLDVIHTGVSVNPVSGTHFDMTQATMTHTFTVTAEDGTTKDYTVTVERGLSSNNYLSKLESNANSETLESIPGFNGVQPTYNLSVPSSQTSIQIYAEADASAKITSSDYSGTVGSTIDITKSLNHGMNQVILTVTSESGQPKIYTINIERKANTEPRLSMIYIDGKSINDYLTGMTFDADGSKNINDTVKEYTLDAFDYDTTSVSVTADSMDSNGSVQGETTYTLETVYANNGNGNHYNVIRITGVAHDTSVTFEYTLRIPRKGNDSTEITDMGVTYDNSFHAATKVDDDHYTITVPNSFDKANSSNVVVNIPAGALPSDAKATASMNETLLSTDDATNGNVNTHIVTITAEDGTTRDITLTITRELSDNAKLNSLTVLDQDGNANIGAFTPVFDGVTETYSVSVPVNTNQFVLDAVKGESHQTITGLGKKTLTSSNETFVVEVTAEDGVTKKTYTLNIVREKSTDNRLQTLEVEDIDGNQYTVTGSNNRYSVTVPGNVEKINILATPVISTSRVEYLGADADTTNTYTISVGTTTKEIQIFSESGVAQSYYLEVTREQKTDNTLKSLKYKLSVDGVETEIDLANPPYVIPEVANSVTKIWFMAETNDSDATVSGDGEQMLSTGTNTFEIVVTAQNGDKQTYSVSIDRAKSSDATLKSLVVAGLNFVETPDFQNVFDYTLNVPETKDKLLKSEITAVPNDSKATVTLDEDLSLVTTSSNVYQIEVVAEDGITKQTYTITVNRPKSTDNTLSNVTLVGGVLSPSFNSNGTEYTITVPYGTTEFTITGIPNVPTSVVTGNGTYPSTNGDVTLSVQSEDTSVAPKEYVFHVVQATSTDASLIDLKVDGYPFVDGTNQVVFSPTKVDYSIGSIYRSVTKVQVSATPGNVNATIKYYHDGVEITSCANQTNCEVTLASILGRKVIDVEVIAADQINSRMYHIDYTKVSSNENKLSSLTLRDLNGQEKLLTPIFNKGTLNYTLTVPNEIDELEVNAVAEDGNASISIDGASQIATILKNVSLVEGANDIAIIVTAEDGTQNTYHVVVTRLAYVGNNDANLSRLEVLNGVDESISYNLSPAFSNTVESYDIGKVPYSLTTLKINAVVNDSKANISYYVNGVEQSSNLVVLPLTSGAITVKVTAEDGTTVKNYVITYSKEASTDVKLTNILVNKSSLTPAFAENVLSYNVVLPTTEDSIDITAMVGGTNATATINGEAYVSGSVKTFSNLAFGDTLVKIIVTAEDGKTSITYDVVITRESEQEMITSVQYGHTIEDGYIKTVAENTTVLDMKNQLDNENSKLVISDVEGNELTDTDIVGTAMVVTLLVDGSEVDSKIIIVKGDTTGDGVVDNLDSGDILNHYVGRRELTGAYFVAADIDSNGSVDNLDSGDVLNHYVGRKMIEFMPSKGN